MPRQRHPRTVIITGASAGVGRAIARRFAEAGCRVGLIARDQAALQDVQRELRACPAQVEFEAVDVADAQALFAAAERLEQRLGPVDIWINDAMETVFSMLSDMTPEEFRRVTEVTYLGFVYGTMAALASMRPRNQGCIIQIGSALAYRGIPLQSAYCGAKHAIRGFTDSLRTELINEGSRVTISMVDLPAVNTPQFDWARAHILHSPRPMGRPVEPEVIADAVYRVVDGRFREYWIGWQTLLTILGNAVAPAFLDRYLARKAVAGQQTDVPLVPDRTDNLDRPVTRLHRTRGSFSNESAERAMLIPGDVARAATVILGAALFFVAGAASARAGQRGGADTRRAVRTRPVSPARSW